MPLKVHTPRTLTKIPQLHPTLKTASFSYASIIASTKSFCNTIKNIFKIYYIYRHDAEKRSKRVAPLFYDIKIESAVVSYQIAVRRNELLKLVFELIVSEIELCESINERVNVCIRLIRGLAKY